MEVSPLGIDSVSEINKVFDWASSNPRGTILLIDEADALFRKRTENLSESLRNSINSFLYRTGTPSKRFMLVIATN
jgi:ATPase family AAA domain-containing protein 3A/B